MTQPQQKFDWKYTNTGYRDEGTGLTIEHDQDADDPNSWGDPQEQDFLVIWLGHRFRPYTIQGLREPSDLEEWTDTHQIVPLGVLEHGGIAIERSPSCAFDSRGGAFALLRKDGQGDIEDRIQVLIDIWNCYLSGDIWGVQSPSGNAVWGIYGLDHAKQEAVWIYNGAA